MKSKTVVLSWSLLLGMFASIQASNAQDSLRISLDEAEQQFLRKNFVLLAAKYRVAEADAAIIQAKLYPNPNLSVNQGLYNQDTKKWFDLSSSGETALSLQQVIVLAGKRNRSIDLARINSRLSTYQFYDLLRTLRYQLRSAFYSLYYLQEPIRVYDREISSLQSLLASYTEQYGKGNIAFKELARLQALQFSLQNERLDLVRQAVDHQSDLRLLISDTTVRPIAPVVTGDGSTAPDISKLRYQDLVDSAMSNRYDLKASSTQIDYARSNLSLQKAMRVPDLTLGANYDRAGSYVRNFNALSVAIDLPFWNRNQGNIRAAEGQVQESQQLESQSRMQVISDIDRAYRELTDADQLYRQAAQQFTGDYERLLDGILKGYENRTISLLEFIDYYETYKN